MSNPPTTISVVKCDAEANNYDDEAALWDELEQQALTSADLDAIAEFLRTTGQASS